MWFEASEGPNNGSCYLARETRRFATPTECKGLTERTTTARGRISRHSPVRRGSPPRPPRLPVAGLRCRWPAGAPNFVVFERNHAANALVLLRRADLTTPEYETASAIRIIRTMAARKPNANLITDLLLASRVNLDADAPA
jgi:hypothetical protein